ncbi:hypothetical protein VNO77_35627 [Canavalia gladiata]|uniref:Uncharacterized protein n=1 Tax=Canavalia gladiata TaxID=3824 RepID=A0AAN9K8B4_CANGL
MISWRRNGISVNMYKCVIWKKKSGYEYRQCPFIFRIESGPARNTMLNSVKGCRTFLSSKTNSNILFQIPSNKFCD